jgi:hypothetical protein
MSVHRPSCRRGSPGSDKTGCALSGMLTAKPRRPDPSAFPGPARHGVSESDMPGRKAGRTRSPAWWRCTSGANTGAPALILGSRFARVGLACATALAIATRPADFGDLNLRLFTYCHARSGFGRTGMLPGGATLDRAPQAIEIAQNRLEPIRRLAAACERESIVKDWRAPVSGPPRDRRAPRAPRGAGRRCRRGAAQ